MKKIILFLLLAFPNCLIAQKYVPFPTDNAKWNVVQIGGDIPFAPDTLLLQYSLQGDTTINGIVYRKLCKNIGTVDEPFYKGIGGLREQDKKIYVVERDFGFLDNEILLYDFNKQVGDTLKINEYTINYIVTGIDSIKIGNEFRKRYKIEERYSDIPAYIIEGIGNVSSGLFEAIIPIPTDVYSAYRKFICFSQNGETVYLNPAFTDCNGTVKTGLKDITATGETVKIYPNPAKDYVQFQFDYPNAQNTSVEMMDYTGREVEIVPVQGLSNYTLNLSSYSPGVYFVVVRSAEGSEVHKIIKM
jgi:hypothetical protein